MCARTRSSTADERRREHSEYRLILIVDIEEFSAPHRDDTTRLRLQADLHRLLTAALSQSGIDAAQYTMRSTGDGWLVLIDPAVGKPRVVGLVANRLAVRLRRRNRRAGLADQLRVRLVVHAGDLLVDPDERMVGDQLNFAFRLLDAQQLRVLLKLATGPVVVCASDDVHRQVIAQRHERLDPAAFEPVWLECKQTRGLGWVRVPDESGVVARAGLLAAEVPVS